MKLSARPRDSTTSRTGSVARPGPARAASCVALAAAVLLGSLVALAPPARAAAGPSVGVSSSSGIVGSNFTVNGSGFLNVSSVRLTFNDSSGHSVQLCGACAVNSNGTFADTFLVPSATNGSAVVAATSVLQSASTSFEVVSHQAFSTYAAPPLTPVAVTDTGFDSAALMFTTFGPVTPAGDCSRRHTSSVGRFLCGFEVPQLPYGNYPVTASDLGANNATNTVSFFVVPGGFTFPSSGTVGSSFELVVDGFPAFAPVSVVWDPGLGSSVVLASLLTNGNGVASATIAVPAAPYGAHTIAASYAPNVTENFTFGVVGSVALDPSAGYVGELGVATLGEGLPASVVVNATWDASGSLAVPLGSASSGPNGSASFAFTVPSASRGSHVVSLSVGASVYASATFVVNVSNVTLDRATAPPGGAFAATLTGFAASASANLVWDLGLPSQSLLANGTTSGAGAATFSGILVPAGAAPGPHTVSATDASGDLASTTLLVGPWLTAVPGSGPTGSTFELDGWSIPSGHLIDVFWNSTAGARLATLGPLSGAVGYPFGNFSQSLIAPIDTWGPHTVVVAVEGTSTVVSTTFSIGPSLSLSSPSATVGTTLVATARGLAPATLATLWIDGTSTGLGTTTDALGSAVFPFVVPPESAGVHTIVAVDALGHPSNTVILTVAPSLSVAPGSGFPGENLTVSLAGFAASSWATVAWDGVGTSALVPTDTHGSAAASLQVPRNATLGTHLLDAWDLAYDAAAPASVSVLGLSAPTLTGPADGAALNRSVVTLAWSSAAADGVRYTVRYAPSPTFAGGEVVVGGVSASALDVGPLADGSYTWQVVAVAPGGVTTNTSADGTFVVDTVAPSSVVVGLPLTVDGLDVSVSFVAQDPTPSSGLEGVELLYSDDGGTSWSDYAGGAVFPSSPIAFHAPHPGRYLFETVAFDRAGNHAAPGAAGSATAVFAPWSGATSWAPAVFLGSAVVLLVVGALLVPRRRFAPRTPAPPPQPWQETDGPEEPSARGGR